MSHSIKITGGPSREELFDGLRLFAENRTVDFTAGNTKPHTMPTIIRGIEPEDGSGNSWIIKIIITAKDLNGLFLPGHLTERFTGMVTINAYYSTHKRQGVLSFE